MAEVWLDEAGWRDGDLPDLCLECGAHAPDRVRKTFVYTPRWVYAMLFVHLLLMVLLMYFIRKQFRSRVPMCPRHKRHWRKRDLWIFFSVLAAGLIGGLGVSLIWLDERLIPLAAVVILSCSVGWVIVFALIHVGTIRLTEFSKRAIRLTRVTPEFADAYEAGPGLDGQWRGRVKADLDPAALRRWSESREDRASIRKDDVPRTSDEYRAG